MKKVNPKTFEIEHIDPFFDKYGITIRDLIHNIMNGEALPYKWLWEPKTK